MLSLSCFTLWWSSLTSQWIFRHWHFITGIVVVVFDIDVVVVVIDVVRMYDARKDDYNINIENNHDNPVFGVVSAVDVDVVDVYVVVRFVVFVVAVIIDLDFTPQQWR